MSIRVIVDLNVCQSYGECVRCAPETFELGDDLVLRYESLPSSELVESAREAEQACPTGAIRVETSFAGHSQLEA
jgi:ferredoxin